MSLSNYVPTNPNNSHRPFSCPKCQGRLQIMTIFNGHDIEEIDPVTGAWDDDSEIIVERDEVYQQEWQCMNSKCQWTKEMEDNEDNEDE